MKIIIIGAGDVGFQIAERLVNEEHDVVIVDRDPEKILEINRSLDVLTIIGQGGDYDVLKKAGIEGCDILIAATDVDETNMIACFIAKKFNVASKIARIRNYLFESEIKNGKGIFTKEELGIDVLINPEEVVTERIVRLISSPSAFEIIEFPEEELIIKGFKITAGLEIANTSIKEIAFYTKLQKMLILAIIRQDEMIIPTGDTKLIPGDKVYIVGKTEDFPDIAPYFHESHKIIKRVFISGVSNITRRLCKIFQTQDIHVKVIEQDRNKCLSFAEEYHKIDVVNCSPTDVESLLDEGLENIDAFIAVSEDEERNILSSMLAKKHKVRKTITKIQKNDYLPFTNVMGIDAVVNPKLSTVGEILKYVRKGNILSVVTLGESNAEAIEYQIGKNSSCTGKPLKEINFPEGSLISAIIRGEERIIPRGNDILRMGDRIIVFTKSEVVKEIGRIFS